jgi:hypothetical protein
MSFAAATHRAPRPARTGPGDGIEPRGLALSGALHVVLIAVLVFGLPTLFSPPPPQEMPIAVDLLNIGPETRTTHPNPSPPQLEAQPVVPEPGPAAAKPLHKPPPPQPMPPPSAAAARVPEPPVRPEPKPAPTPPPPLPQLKPAPPATPDEAVTARRPREKPPPPRPKANDESQTRTRQYNPGRFDALLRNLTAQENPPTPDAPPQRSAEAADIPSSQPEAPLGSRLTVSEIDLVRAQISRCWDIPAGARDDPGLVVEIRVVVAPDGNVESATIVNKARVQADPFYRAAAESARRAFFNPECRPLRLPPDKYELWHDMVVDFSPKDLS